MDKISNGAALPTTFDTGGNLSNLLVGAAVLRPHACALIYQDMEISYRELDLLSRRAASYLQNIGIRAGDHVGVQIPNSPAFVALYFGILMLGATVVPQNPLSTAGELRQNMSDAKVQLVFTQSFGHDVAKTLRGGAQVVAVKSNDGLDLFGEFEPLQVVQEVPGDATAVILYTSGTTGNPKGAELTHANLSLNAAAAIEIYSLVPEDVVLGVLPLYHSYGQTCTLNGSIAVQARVVLADRFDAAPVARLIDQHKVTVFLGVPTMFSDVAHCPQEIASFDSLRICGAGGAPLPPEIRRNFERRSRAPLFETYGLSETSPIASINRRGTERRTGTIGWPIAGVEMKIVAQDRSSLPTGEIGEIAVRGHNVMKGYWNNPEATHDAIDRDGWFFTGDLGTVDDSGCFSVVGRLKDLIIRGGFNVYAAEIEHVLDTHPAVRMAAVVGIPDERLGEEVGAAIVLEAGADISTDTLIAWSKKRLAPYKYPRHIWIVDELPLGPTGKILKRLLVPPSGIDELSSVTVVEESK